MKIGFTEITCYAFGSDATLFKGIINQGIDSHLEAFTKSEFEEKQYKGRPALVMEFHHSELPLLVRRLEEKGTEEADMWASDIRDLPEYGVERL